MRISKPRIDVCLLCALFVIGSGCVAYRSAIPPQAERYEKQSGGMLSAELIVNAEHWSNGEPYQQAHEKALERHRKAAEKVLLASGLFKEAAAELDNPDITIVFSTKEEEHYNAAIPYISGATLLIVPAFMNVTEETSCKITDPDGTLLAEFSAEGRMNVIIQLLLFPAIPSVGIVSRRATEDLYRSVAVDMQNHPRIKELLAAKTVPGQ